MPGNYADACCRLHVALINRYRDTTTDPTDMINYPRPFEVFLQWLFTWGGGILNSLTAFKLIAPKYQAAIMGMQVQREIINKALTSSKRQGTLRC